MTMFLQSNILFYFVQNTFFKIPRILNKPSTMEKEHGKPNNHRIYWVFIKPNVLIQKYNVKNKSIIYNAL